MRVKNRMPRSSGKRKNAGLARAYRTIQFSDEQLRSLQVIEIRTVGL
jgi:hypothetical protein